VENEFLRGLPPQTPPDDLQAVENEFLRGLPPQTSPDDLQALSLLIGAPVVATERCGWGFENRTDALTLADGRRLVLQRIANRALAPHKLRLARTLPSRLAAVGLRVPRLLAADAAADPPYAIREFLPGQPGAALLDSDAGARRLAVEMGALLPGLAEVATDGLALPDGWTTPQLERQARQQLERCGPLLDARSRDALAATIDAVAVRFAGRAARFAHGDFCPVNVLVADGRVVALLDVEFARLADPLFDAAWWGWVVRYHHPGCWAAAWPALLGAAGITQDGPTLGRIQALQRLRCLELLDQAREPNPASAAMWAARLVETLQW
jgi:aminoglycoside phosphotransferase (APT) family kinase protein